MGNGWWSPRGGAGTAWGRIADAGTAWGRIADVSAVVTGVAHLLHVSVQGEVVAPERVEHAIDVEHNTLYRACTCTKRLKVVVCHRGNSRLLDEQQIVPNPCKQHYQTLETCNDGAGVHAVGEQRQHQRQRQHHTAVAP